MSCESSAAGPHTENCVVSGLVLHRRREPLPWGAGGDRGGLHPNAPCAPGTSRPWRSWRRLPACGVGGLGVSHNSAQLWKLLRRGRRDGAALTVQPGLPVRSHPQEGLQRGDKSGEASGRGCKRLAPPPVHKAPNGPPLPAHPRDNAPSAGLPPTAAPTSSRPPPPGPLFPLCIAAGAAGGRRARDAGGCGAARRAPLISPRRPPPCWPRSCDPPRAGESSPGSSHGNRQGAAAPGEPGQSEPRGGWNQGDLANQKSGVLGPCVPNQSKNQVLLGPWGAWPIRNHGLVRPWAAWPIRNQDPLEPKGPCLIRPQRQGQLTNQSRGVT